MTETKTPALSARHFEKLGVFYLGREVDWQTGETSGELLLYDAKDLTTHALIVGMTGSGKTGLSVDLIEEAALDGLPTLVIDPKGDMGNLLLSFPELRPEDFEPWIDPAVATRNGRTVEEEARATAELWAGGLAKWGQDGERIAAFRRNVDLAIYTPGSTAGRQLSVLGSFEPPGEALGARALDEDALQERIAGAVSGLLALLGIAADPVGSREHILLANLFDQAWRSGRGLDLAGLVQGIQKPPFEKLGVIDLETFYPAKERTALALRLNGLLASPGFAAWLEGEPLDVGALLYTPSGKPRISIVSIAHLSDAERMFVVTLLLGEVVSWMRAQSGTSSLRALLYMDEIFGFFPPSAEPASKRPMLTLLKQARAYGLGVVLATQNPVDLDYKGLSNCGTWWIGRLQTERDVDRVMAGLEGASAAAGRGLDSGAVRRTIGGLGKRTFLMNDVHEEGPVLFKTRWAMSYLRGPLTRAEISRLSAASPAARPASPPPFGVPPPRLQPAEPVAEGGARPILPQGIEERFLIGEADSAGEDEPLYRPHLFARAHLHYKRAGVGVDLWRNLGVLAPISAGATGRGGLEWQDAEIREEWSPNLRKRPAAGARYAPLPAAAQRPSAYARASKDLAAELYRTRVLRVFTYPPFKEQSEPLEDEATFRQRLVTRALEERDLEVEKLRQRHAGELERLDRRIESAEARVASERAQLADRRMATVVSVGTSVLGALLGRKRLSATNVNRAGTAIRGVGRSRKEAEDVDLAEERLEDLLEKRKELERELEAELAELRAHTVSPAELRIEEVEVRPLKGDLAVEDVCLAWVLDA
ncbi:MAG TPA: DUF87 domain-containing protein [Thermoanaerobaculia bacterium]|nr:DUF87 domain-containing protein [Thermoanaerobaculia bacterium]